ncbi:MAG TPA: hypothetical protein VEY92_00740 [Pseudoxanthomonas sp.]|nr:hypothetical protein [Pseudoxanthomonas sp.]
MHSARFIALMAQFMPHWRERRTMLNRLPVRDEQWIHSLGDKLIEAQTVQWSGLPRREL